MNIYYENDQRKGINKIIVFQEKKLLLFIAIDNDNCVAPRKLSFVVKVAFFRGDINIFVLSFL